MTHIVVPEGTEAGAVPRSHCPSALVVSEAWVARRARALQAGQLTAATPPAAKAKAKGKKRAAQAVAGGEKRAARERVPTAASAMRLHRALSERLYLVERRDRSEVRARVRVRVSPNRSPNPSPTPSPTPNPSPSPNPSPNPNPSLNPSPNPSPSPNP